MADAAAALAERGWDVVVLTSNRGYDNPNLRYPSHELIRGVRVRRLGFSSFGKTSLLLRLLGGFSFVLQCALWGMFVPRLAGVLVSTSPPMCSLAALLISWVRRVPTKYWVMDLNPDQAIALGRFSADAAPCQALDALNQSVLRQAADVVVLDRFMAQRVNRKLDVAKKMAILPPWPHEDELADIPHDKNPFRKEHGLDGKFVIMYSGNLSIASPVTTILQAALSLRDHDQLKFLFVGGGLGKGEIDELMEKHRPANIMSLPYQPLSQLKYSLSAADVHLVAMGEQMAGIIHPCKVYGAMAAGRPILFLGPKECHIADLLQKHRIGWHVNHGDIAGAIRTINEILQTDAEERAAMGMRARNAIREHLSKKALLDAFTHVIEACL
jgi:glycosyltransferase involved in cell wall biosynthesis